MTLESFYTFLTVMAAIAVVVFVVLFFVDAGYGKFINPKFGPTIPNKIAWFLMEVPVFIAMTILWLRSDVTWQVMPLVFFVIFQTHYFQRSLVFPFLIRGKGRMPISIMLMGATFNTLNALMQGGWIFKYGREVNPAMYDISWLWSWQFILGVVIFVAGFVINLHSDYIIRHLRKPGDTRHYIPRGGMFRYVSSANYFGEFMEWCGFALLTWSPAGVVFALWTFANLGPRANSIWHKYEKEFGEEFTSLGLKRMIPFIY
ncbi:MAG: DUF1295 domain-containing protein [Rikenellaceae bacterium]|nr:DUF1295 domain-containing protein [Rikenellaceae bacterium]